MAKATKRLDARQIAFLQYYMDSKSETFGNAFQSALRAGYNESYARNITTKAGQWLGEIEVRRQRLLNKAERNLEEFLDIDPLIDAIGPFGPIRDKESGEILKRYSTGVAALKLQATIFTAETVGKKTYSKRTDLNFVDPSQLQLTDKEKAEILAIYAENMPKQLNAAHA